MFGRRYWKTAWKVYTWDRNFEKNPLQSAMQSSYVDSALHPMLDPLMCLMSPIMLWAPLEQFREIFLMDLFAQSVVKATQVS